jgi:molybdopterin-guanine dinucleotide biosynthesis protein A
MSSRMGRDKARLRLGRRTLLGVIRQTVHEIGLPCRAIERDLIPKCGPLSGIFTALHTSKAQSELFLACDMPFISAKSLEHLIGRYAAAKCPVFARSGEGLGFPCILPISCLALVEMQIAEKQFSLQRLAMVCGAETIDFPDRETLNLNTPAEFAEAKKLLEKTRAGSKGPKKPRKTGL